MSKFLAMTFICCDVIPSEARNLLFAGSDGAAGQGGKTALTYSRSKNKQIDSIPR
jgi:hypothetical protein